jgi:hypothetical protein
LRQRSQQTGASAAGVKRDSAAAFLPSGDFPRIAGEWWANGELAAILTAVLGLQAKA